MTLLQVFKRQDMMLEIIMTGKQLLSSSCPPAYAAISLRRPSFDALLLSRNRSYGARHCCPYACLLPSGQPVEQEVRLESGRKTLPASLERSLLCRGQIC